MTIVHRENPDLFDLFYGDYQGIISNYLKPMHNIDLILKGSQKYIDSNKTKEAYRILCYFGDYFENCLDELVYKFIQQHIIVDYYNNNCLLERSVVALIKKLKKLDSKRIGELLIFNTRNINFYKNKEELYD